MESMISAAVAAIATGGMLTSRLHARINELERRIDHAELTVARDYVAKTDIMWMAEKLDRLTETKYNS